MLIIYIERYVYNCVMSVVGCGPCFYVFYMCSTCYFFIFVTETNVPTTGSYAFNASHYQVREGDQLTIQICRENNAAGIPGKLYVNLPI